MYTNKKRATELIIFFLHNFLYITYKYAGFDQLILVRSSFC